MRIRVKRILVVLIIFCVGLLGRYITPYQIRVNADIGINHSDPPRLTTTLSFFLQQKRPFSWSAEVPNPAAIVQKYDI